MQTQYETAINDSGVFYALIAEIFEQPPTVRKKTVASAAK